MKERRKREGRRRVSGRRSGRGKERLKERERELLSARQVRLERRLLSGRYLRNYLLCIIYVPRPAGNLTARFHVKSHRNQLSRSEVTFDRRAIPSPLAAGRPAFFFFFLPSASRLRDRLVDPRNHASLGCCHAPTPTSRYLSLLPGARTRAPKTSRPCPAKPAVARARYFSFPTNPCSPPKSARLNSLNASSLSTYPESRRGVTGAPNRRGKTRRAFLESQSYARGIAIAGESGSC